ncbi:MAG: HAMP domain-containing histidine kinase, partial [Elusimicrobia bacterium]|nr:HAMP domain-containing histidine kinase [Elusimicrobiota bacterium]
PEPQPDDVGQMLKLQFSNIHRLQKILDHILDLSRLEAGEVELALRPVDARPLLEDVAAGTRLVAGERGVAFEHRVPEALPPVRADGELLQQVLGNLLDNALRFARSRVVLSAEATPDETGVRFSVRDDGVGIPGDRLGDVFRKFVQVQRAADGSGYKGTGLGLAICRQIVERHSGRIWAENGEGGGAAFHFVIPLAAPARAPGAAAPED